MSNIAAPATLPAGTGTGITYNGLRFLGDTAKYVESAPAGVPSVLVMKAFDPKPTRDYPGAAKGEVKLTESVTDAAGRQWPMVVTVTSSIPDFVSGSNKDAFINRAIIAANTSESRATLARGLVPQS
jgi:hypothetical protein